MKFAELKEAHEEYQIKSNMKTFNEYSEKETWNIGNLSERSVEEDVLGFLNKWGVCRIPYDRKTKLLPALKKVEKAIIFFKDKLLWEHFNFDDERQRSLITNIFWELGKIDRISSVAISKILHLYNPYFFVMWDNAIMENYGFYNNVEGYLNFLQKMKSEIVQNDLFSSYLESETKNEVTLLKLIDEYNMERMRGKKNARGL